MIYLRQNTASQEICLGYFVDSTDGNTEETGLTIANTDIKLWKNGATTLANKNSGGATHISNGLYYATLDDTDTNTLGAMIIYVHVAGALSIKLDCTVLPATVYDSLILGTDYLQIDAIQIEGVDATNQIRDSLVDDATRIDASALNTLSSHDPGGELPLKTDVTGLNDLSSSDIQTACDAAITANTDIDAILVDTNEIQGKLPTNKIMGSSDVNDHDTDIDTILGRIVGTIAAGTHNPQSGDGYSILNNGTYGLSAIETLVDELESRLTALRAGYLDNLNIGENVAGLSDITGLSIPTAVSIRQEIDNNSTQLSDIKTVTDKLDTAMELDGAVYRYTENALEQAPSGSSGDATAANQTTIINHLTSIKDNNGGSDFDSSTDSLEAIRNRGDAAWTTGGGLTGSNECVLTIQDELAANIVECYVEVWDSLGTTFYERKITDSGGQTTHNLDDGTYTIKIHKAGYSFDNETLIVDGDETETYTGTAYSIEIPSSPGICRVYEYCMGQDGEPVSSLTATATIIRLPYDYTGSVFSGETVTGTYNSTTGLVYWDIIQGATTKFIITNFGVKIVKTIPTDAVTIRLSDMT